MNDPWIQIVSQIVPDYNELAKEMWKEDSGVYLNVTKKSRTWWAKIFQENTEFYTDNRFDEIIEWSDSQLKNWTGVYRIAYDTWVFNKQKDVLKFKTLYGLRWEVE